MATVTNTELPDRQRQFCLEYLKDFNGAQAAIRAGYSDKAAKETASELLTKPNIQAFIRNRTQAEEDKYDLSRERVARQYARLAFFDIRKLYDENGNLLPVHELDEDTAVSINGLEVEEQHDFFGRLTTKTKKLKTSDIKGALDSVSKFMGHNMPDKVEQSGKIETVVTIKRD